MLCSVNRIVLSFLFVFTLSSFALSQGGAGQVTGIVQDSSQALIPGVTITLSNPATGTSSTQLTNETGSYTFLSVPPGTYTVSASLPGFKTSVTNSVQVGLSAQVRLNITLEVGTLDARVEVSVTGDQVLKESGASVGDVLPASRAMALPLVGNDVMDLVKILPGYRLNPNSAVGTVVNDTFAGQTLDTVNVTRDGLSVNSGRYDPRTYGLTTTTNINPELVGEIRLILSPVDAELGRGNSQIQISTRSGTNRYSGSAVWNVQNSALNANTWANNRNVTNGVWSPIQPDWRNAHNITLTYGGPIVRNKTFFFASWDQQISNTRTTQTPVVYTDAARQGIFRYWENWNPLNATVTGEPTSYPVAANTASRPSVDFSGNPLTPTRNPDGSDYTGVLRCFSVFGNVKVDGSAFSQNDCPGGVAVINSGPWDPLRLAPDATGYIAKILNVMPRANYFSAGDGLNTAGYRYTRSAKGQGGNNAVVGVADFVNRKQFTVKIDQYLGAKHRISGSWSYQRDFSGDFLAAWPDGINGEVRRNPQTLTINATSTLSSSMLNEARFGIRRDRTGDYIPYDSSDSAVRQASAEWYLQGSANPENGVPYPLSFTPGGVGNGIISTGSQTLGNYSPLYNYADTFSWAKGRHAFKFGGEVRLTRSTGWSPVGGNVMPIVTGGAPTGFASNLAAAANSTDPIFTQLTGFLASAPTGVTAARTASANLLYFMNGGIANASMLRWIDDASDVPNAHWEDKTTVGLKYRDQRSNEYSFFWKDDWKFNKNLTLNFGVRYDYYQSPYIGSGFTTAPLDLGRGLLGMSLPLSGETFDQWLTPGNTYLTGYGSSVSAANSLVCAPGVTQAGVTQPQLLPVSTCDPSRLTQIEFVGPNTPNPKKVAVPNDSNNFGPAIGFSWQLPWLGEGKTTIRGGYQLTYAGAGRDAVSLDSLLGGAPGAINSAALNINDPTPLDPSITFANILATRALTLSDLPNIVPVRATAQPGQTLPIYGRYNADFNSYDPNFRTPYTQNLTLQVTRSLSSVMTVDVRYVGTLGRKLQGTINLNSPAVYNNPELVDALNVTRAGGNSPLFDLMFAGLDLHGTTGTGYGAVGTCVNQATGSTVPGLGQEGCAANQVRQHGSAHLRRNATFTGFLANGNYVAAVDALANLSAVQSGLQPAPSGQTGVSARILRNGCDRIANNTYNPAQPASNTNIPTRCFPEDYFYANPQFNNGSGANGAPNYIGNLGHNNYHSMQVQYTLRPVQGISFQSTYTWAKSLTDRFNSYTNPLNRSLDYTYDRSLAMHEFRTNGTFELPVGPNKLLFANASGWLARVVERWQTSIIFNTTSGQPRTPFSSQKLYVAGANSPNPTSRPDIVGPWIDPQTDYQWNGPNNNSGTVFGSPSPYVTFSDPQCTNNVGATDGMGFNLRSSCTLRGLAAIVPAGTTGAILMADGVTYGLPLLQNSMPGTQGTLGANSLRLPGRWTLDGNIGKTFRLTESKTLQIRFDATNILNHTSAGEPDLNVQADTFGQVTTRQGSPRAFQGQLRLAF
jgi:hypothetical protein